MLVPVEMETVPAPLPSVLQSRVLGKWGFHVTVEPLNEYTFQEACEMIEKDSEEQGIFMESELFTNANDLTGNKFLTNNLEITVLEGENQGQELALTSVNYMF